MKPYSCGSRIRYFSNRETTLWLAANDTRIVERKSRNVRRWMLSPLLLKENECILKKPKPRLSGLYTLDTIVLLELYLSISIQKQNMARTAVSTIECSA